MRARSDSSSIAVTPVELSSPGPLTLSLGRGVEVTTPSDALRIWLRASGPSVLSTVERVVESRTPERSSWTARDTSPRASDWA